MRMAYGKPHAARPVSKIDHRRVGRVLAPIVRSPGSPGRLIVVVVVLSEKKG